VIVQKGILLVQTEPVAGREDEYHRWYEEVHIPEVLIEQSFTAARRFELVSHDQAGRPIGEGDLWRYLAVYEVEADDLAEALASVQARTLVSSDAVRTDLPDRFQLFVQISAHPHD
jgi:hypothetical protein